MLFRPFPKLTSALPDGAPEGPYVALEKIHGAQLVLGVGADGTLRAGKRKAWLDPEEPFFGWQVRRAELEEAARAFRALAAGEGLLGDGDDFVLFGELFGGAYPHPDVPPLRALSAVQTGMWYAPDLRWAPFAALVAAEGEAGGTLLAPSVVADLASRVGWIGPPVVARGNRAEVAAAPERFASRVPAALGLPPLDGNVAEGYVVWLDRPMPFARPVAAKRKIPEMREAALYGDAFDGSAAFDASRALPLADLLALLPSLVNRARIESARSKVGGHDPRALLDEVELDVLIDLQAALPIAVDALTDAEAARLGGAIRELAGDVAS